MLSSTYKFGNNKTKPPKFWLSSLFGRLFEVCALAKRLYGPRSAAASQAKQANILNRTKPARPERDPGPLLRMAGRFDRGELQLKSSEVAMLLQSLAEAANENLVNGSSLCLGSVTLSKSTDGRVGIELRLQNIYRNVYIEDDVLELAHR